MQPRTAWVWEHVEHIKLWFSAVVRYFISAVFFPVLLPFFFYCPEIVFHVTYLVSGFELFCQSRHCKRTAKHFAFMMAKAIVAAAKVEHRTYCTSVRRNNVDKNSYDDIQITLTVLTAGV